MFQSPGLVCQPDCHRAGMPAALHNVVNDVFCTPQSPRRAVSPSTDKLGMMLYSCSAHQGTFFDVQRKMRNAFSSGLVSLSTIFRTSSFTSGVKTMCGGRSAVYSR